MVRTTLGAEVETTVSVQGAEQLKIIDATITSDIPNTVKETVIVRSNTGTVFNVRGIRVTTGSPGGQSSKQHDVFLKVEGTAINQLTATASGDKPIAINDNIIQDADKDKVPSTEQAQATVLQNLTADDSNGLSIEYRNISGATQTNRILIQVLVREVRVSEP